MMVEVACLILSLSSAVSAPVERDTRIVNGEAVDIREVPYQASLRSSRSSGWSHICGAVVVSRTAALTAAHCVDGAEQPLLYRVVVGTSYRDVGGREYSVSKIIKHPQYYELINDIAVLQVSAAFTFSETVQPISLAPASLELPEGTSAVVSGYGTLYFSGPSSASLQAATVFIVNQRSCMESYRDLYSLLPTMICAGSADPARDACQGDSGGPLVAEGVLVGLVSWGEGCGQEAYPGVYTRIGEYQEWIMENVDDLISDE